MTKEKIIQRIIDLVNDYNMQGFEVCNDIETSWDPIQWEKGVANSITLYTLNHHTFGLPPKLIRYIFNKDLKLIFSSRLDYYEGTMDVMQCYPTATIYVI